jgi:SAM-dependent methyltransferase
MNKPHMSQGKEAQQRWERTWSESPPETLPWEEGRPSQVLVELVEGQQVPPGAALDICCGTGANAVYLAQQGFEASGIDISPTAMAYARKRAQQEGVQVSLQAGDATHLPYPDGTFSFVFDRGCFHNIAPGHREGFIQGLHRVLKPGGLYQLLCFSSRSSDADSPPYGFSPEDIDRLFSTHFHILGLRETAFRERDGEVRFFLSVLMEKADSKRSIDLPDTPPAVGEQEAGE